MRRLRPALLAAALLTAAPAAAQQRPLLTEDAETIGAGRVLLDAGVEYGHDVQYPVSGLTGNLLQIPTVGLRVGLSSIAELQIDGGFFDYLSITGREPAPLSPLLTVTGDSTHDVHDFVVATKIRAVPETDVRPAFGVRLATKLGNASVRSGLGTHSIDFYVSLLAAKTIGSFRVAGDVGAGIISDPTDGNRENDVLTYGVSVGRGVTSAVEIVGEVNGRVNTRSNGALPGSETRGLFRLGARSTRGAVRWDAAVQYGLTDIDPSIGFTAGVSYIFNAFKVP